MEAVVGTVQTRWSPLSSPQIPLSSTMSPRSSLEAEAVVLADGCGLSTNRCTPRCPTAARQLDSACLKALEVQSSLVQDHLKMERAPLRTARSTSSGSRCNSGLANSSALPCSETRSLTNSLLLRSSLLAQRNMLLLLSTAARTTSSSAWTASPATSNESGHWWMAASTTSLSLQMSSPASQSALPSPLTAAKTISLSSVRASVAD
mmetsp:Transcript_40138/g.60658  ORF Transcript_40138/g.60658 Transcript_40138/m.60658 type:complete len:206 (-) Transcript_40138:23-640(-)